MNRYRKSFTLTELMLAIALMGVLVLAAYAFSNSSAIFMRSTDVKTEVLNEATRVMEHISKNAMCAHGNVDNLGIEVEVDKSITIRQDVFGCMANAAAAYTPERYDDDVIVRYEFAPADSPNEIRFYPDVKNNPATYETLTKKLKTVNISVAQADPGVPPNTIKIKSMYYKHPAAEEDPRLNPPVELETKVYGYGISLK